MKPRSIIFYGVVAGVLIGGIFMGMAKESHYAIVDRGERYAHWKERIEAVGGAKAYAELAEDIGALSIREKLMHVHVFGIALYEVLGIPGLSVCDAKFSFGCFHEFLGEAIADKGVEIVPMLNTACAEALADSSPLSCQHGLGHGIQSYVGYEPDDLIEGLEICHDLKNDRIGGCYGGIFMEFNLRTMWGEEARPRETTREHVADTCISISEEFRPACFYWSPQWWLQALYGDSSSESSFTTLGDICISTTGSETLRRDCFDGIGTIVPSSASFEPRRTARLCDAVSSRPLDRLYCRASAANILSVDVGREKGEASCVGLMGNSFDYCVAYAQNRANVFNRALISEENL